MTPLGYPKGFFLDLFPEHSYQDMYRANIIAYQISKRKFFIYKARMKFKAGIVDMSCDSFLKVIKSFKYLGNPYSDHSFEMRFKIDKNFTLKIDIVREDILFYYNYRPCSFEYFINHVDSSIAKPFLFDLDFWSERSLHEF